MTLDPNGWTVLTPSGDSRLIYVSSSGSDGNDGLSESAPKKTISAGKALLRDGFPDCLLLKRGDVWTDEVIGTINVNGRSADEPMVIGAYGTGARPLLQINARGIGTTFGDYIAVVGLEFYAYKRDPDNPSYDSDNAPGSTVMGAQILTAFNWLLFEDLKFTFCSSAALSLQPASAGGTAYIRRCILADSWSDSGVQASQGLYAEKCHVVVEENLFDHNGWNETGSGGEPTIFCHNVYIQRTSLSAIFRRNISARASSHGAQVRIGGFIVNNLFCGCPVPLLVGGSGNNLISEYTVNAAQCGFNVILEASDIGEATRGWGIDFRSKENPTGLLRVAYNVIAHNASADPTANQIAIDTAVTGAEIVNNVLYDHGAGGIDDNGTGNTVANNEIDGEGYPDPDRTISTYMTSLGGTASLEAFLAEARLQSKGNWREAYTAAAVNDYIRAGFDMNPTNPVRMRLT